MKRIVISGTYCTGKTTTALALSLATGIPTSHGPTMREILPKLFPGKTLRKCSYAELLALGMHRFSQRILTETSTLKQSNNGFISDGCPLQEWLYGSTRLYTGAYPDEHPIHMKIKKIVNYRQYKDFRIQLSQFEHLAKAYSKTQYDTFFHLPVEFDFIADGHRPTSERFRNLSEIRLLQTYRELNLTPFIISGSLEERLSQIINHLKIKPIISIDQAIRQAEQSRKQHFDSIKLEHS